MSSTKKVKTFSASSNFPKRSNVVVGISRFIMDFFRREVTTTTPHFLFMINALYEITNFPWRMKKKSHARHFNEWRRRVEKRIATFSLSKTHHNDAVLHLKLSAHNLHSFAQSRCRDLEFFLRLNHLINTSK